MEMTREKRKCIPVVIALVVFAAALVFAGVYDLDISLAVADPMSVFGRLLEILGEPPAILFTAFNCALIAARFLKKPEKKRKYYALTALACVGMVGTSFYTVHATFKYAFAWSADINGTELIIPGWVKPVSVLICVVISAIMLVIAMRMKRETLDKIFDTACRCVFVGVTTFVVIWLFKLVWGRIRFRSMDGDYSLFTRWFIPQGFTGNYSFPSGHTSNAAVIFTSTYYLRFTGKKYLKPVMYSCLTVWLVTVALSRVLVGAHFLSDVLCGMAITLTIVRLWRPKKEPLFV